MIFFFLLFKWLISMLNSPYSMMLFFLILAMISPAKGQTVPATCDSSSPQCCKVVRSWQLMGKTTPSVDHTNATACCYYLGSTNQTLGIPGVTCSSTGQVTKIEWIAQGLTGPIPLEIGDLVNLQHL
jgi:hypothetical protein